MMKKFAILIFLTLVTAPQANGAVILVNRGIQGGLKTIQAGINSAKAGDTVAIADGLYVENIILKSGVSLRGRGSGLSRIEYNGDKPVIYGRGVKDVTLSGISISYNGNEKVPLILLTASNVSISNTLLYSSPLSAVEAKKGSKVDIKNSLIKGNMGSGLLSIGSKISIRKSIISGNRYFGIDIKDKGEASIKDSYINENQTGGVLVRERGKATLQNNLVIGNIFNGIWVKDGTCLASNNTIAGNTQAAIRIESAAKGKITNNIIYRNATGIRRKHNKKRKIRTTRNLFWGNLKNYDNISKGKGDMVANPMFDNNYIIGKKSPLLKKLKGKKSIGATPTPIIFPKLEDNATIFGQNKEISYKTHYKIGIAYLNKGEYDKAIAEFNKSIHLKREYPLPYYQLGVIYNQKGKLDKARDAYQNGIAVAPNNAAFHLALGEIYWKRKEYSLAQEELKKAVKIDKKDKRGQKILEKIEFELQKNRDNKKQN